MKKGKRKKHDDRPHFRQMISPRRAITLALCLFAVLAVPVLVHRGAQQHVAWTSGGGGGGLVAIGVVCERGAMEKAIAVENTWKRRMQGKEVVLVGSSMPTALRPDQVLGRLPVDARVQLAFPSFVDVDREVQPSCWALHEVNAVMTGSWYAPVLFVSRETAFALVYLWEHFPGCKYYMIADDGAFIAHDHLKDMLRDADGSTEPHRRNDPVVFTGGKAGFIVNRVAMPELVRAAAVTLCLGSVKVDNEAAQVVQYLERSLVRHRDGPPVKVVPLPGIYFKSIDYFLHPGDVHVSLLLKDHDARHAQLMDDVAVIHHDLSALEMFSVDYLLHKMSRG